jgi:hypothetical protein
MANATQEHTATAASSQPAKGVTPHGGDHERLFRLLEEVGPAPAEFMLNVSDPFIERELILDDEDES